jgi:uncharacterized protein YndB with AHSA1/START domain
MTETADPRVIEIDQFYPHPPQRVWRALTTPELMARWLMQPSGFAPVVATRFSFQGQPMAVGGLLRRDDRRGRGQAAGDQLG